MQAFALLFFLNHTSLEQRLWKYLMANMFVRNKKTKPHTPEKNTKNTQKKNPKKQKINRVTAVLCFKPVLGREVCSDIEMARNLKISHFIFQFLL